MLGELESVELNNKKIQIHQTRNCSQESPDFDFDSKLELFSSLDSKLLYLLTIVHNILAT